MSNEMGFFSADFTESPEQLPAPAGNYKLVTYGLPRMKITKKNEPMLVWQLNHVGEGAKYGPVFLQVIRSAEA